MPLTNATGVHLMLAYLLTNLFLDSLVAHPICCACIRDRQYPEAAMSKTAGRYLYKIGLTSKG